MDAYQTLPTPLGKIVPIKEGFNTMVSDFAHASTNSSLVVKMNPKAQRGNEVGVIFSTLVQKY